MPQLIYIDDPVLLLQFWLVAVEFVVCCGQQPRSGSGHLQRFAGRVWLASAITPNNHSQKVCVRFFRNFLVVFM
jgi:hypothetical protein